jgi:hypothetical protein
VWFEDVNTDGAPDISWMCDGVVYFTLVLDDICRSEHELTPYLPSFIIVGLNNQWEALFASDPNQTMVNMQHACICQTQQRNPIYVLKD